MERAAFCCDLCGEWWTKREAEKDGNHFVTCSTSWIMEKLTGYYGKTIKPHRDADPNVLRDVNDGSVYSSMQLAPSDLGIILHADGARLSQSTNKKLYLIFAQCPQLAMLLLWLSV